MFLLVQNTPRKRWQSTDCCMGRRWDCGGFFAAIRWRAAVMIQYRQKDAAMPMSRQAHKRKADYFAQKKNGRKDGRATTRN